jgi:NitT/TauT family transport system permease protein
VKFARGIFSSTKRAEYPNYWDVGALAIVFAVIVAVVLGAKQMSSAYMPGHAVTISLSPHALPAYALRTVLRMFVAMFFSLLFTFVFGALAAKSKHAERIIIPLVDILQSVPILGFLSISVPMFLGLFPHSMLGPECAAIFAIFTSQAWNMMLGFYQSLCMVPEELKEAAAVFHLSAWQRFWRVEVPMTIPSLLWNMMLSMSAGWFFVVASEAISVNHQTIMLPGIGSYIAVAISHQDLHAIAYAIIAMLFVILLYDQLLFRPLVAWAEKFKAELAHDDVSAQSWVVDLFRSTRWVSRLAVFWAYLRDALINIRFFQPKRSLDERGALSQYGALLAVWLWYGALFVILLSAVLLFCGYVYQSLGVVEVVHAFLLGGVTALRVMVLIAVCSLVWIPIGVWIGLRPRVAAVVQPVAQFLAAFPANLLFPLVVVMIIRFKLNVEIWTSPLMILGTQWYILFNVIAGTTALPKELLQVSQLFGVRSWLRWRSVILPAIFPYFITGAMTAAGGAWNASIVAEVVTWGSVTLKATGLGAYIQQATVHGDVAKQVLGIVVMCLFVLLINRLLWRRLYRLAEERFHVE